MAQELDMALVVLVDFVSSPLVLTLAGLSLLLYAFWWALTAECFSCVRSSPPVEGEHLLPVTAKRSDGFPAPAENAAAEKNAAERAEKKAATEGKAAAEAKAADDKLWIFTEKWFNLQFVLQYHKQSLYAFAAAGLVEIEARGSSFGFRSLELTVKSLAYCPLRVVVPRGTWFHNRTPFHQPLVNICDRWIEIEPGALVTVELDAFCGIRTYGCPLRDEMELSPYVFDGDDLMQSQVKVWDYLSRYVPVGKAAAEAKAADDKLWIFTEKWFNLQFVLQYHKQSLYAFAAAGLVEIEARGSSFGFRSLELTVKSLAYCPLRVVVPRGTWFHNRTPFHQPLVTIRDYWIEIEPGALATVELDAFCGSRSYGCPDRDEMELSPYVFDGDDVMQSQVKVWDYFSRYVPAIPRKHQPSNPAASILPNPQLDEEAAKAVVENMRDQEHKAAAAQAKALQAEAAKAKAATEGKAAAEAKAADDKLWIFTEKWFNLQFVLQYHKQSLYAFAAAGLVEIEARGSSFGFRSLELTVKSLAYCPLRVVVPRGTWFHNRTPFHQPLVTIRDYWIEIEPGALATVELDAFCGSRSYGCPDRDEMELSPYVFDGDDVMQSQVKVWDYFSRYVPAIPRKHQPSNPAASILPNPQLDEEAAKAVVENMRDQEHKAAAAQAKALQAEAAKAKAATEGKAAAEAKAADDKLWIFTEKWFNLQFVLQYHKQSLYAFAAAGLVEIEARGSSFGFRSLELTVKSLAYCPLRVVVPRGTWFHNRTPFHQPLVTIRDYWIEIEPGALATVELDAFCGSRSYGCPDRDEMELSPYVFDGDDVMQSQVKVWDYFSRYVPAIPRKHQPSNPAASILPNPQLDEEAAKAVVENMRDQERKAAAAQAKALRARAKAVKKEPRDRWEGTSHAGPWGQWYAPARIGSTSLGCCCCLSC